jgi:DNA-directed RNA polymerase specialized sigma24 family protein
MVGRVRYLAQRARVEDVEAVVAEWRCRAWQVFPRLVGENERAVASGKAPPHAVGKYLTKVAKNLLVDLHRAEEAERRGLGRREVAPRLEERRRARLALEEEELGETGVDAYVDERAEDPAEVVVRAERREALVRGMEGLPAEERRALVGWLAGETDGARAAREGTSPMAAWRRRQRGLARLREALRAAGWELRKERRGRGGVVRVRGRRVTSGVSDG